MPATIEKIEIITQPGAEFPATSGGAILNIITNKMQKNLSATYTNSTSFTSYDDVRLRMNNSLLLSAKNKYFGWQLNLGQNYRKRRVVFSSKTGKWHEFLTKRMPIVQGEIILSNRRSHLIWERSFVA
jgi:hypothetical protein